MHRLFSNRRLLLLAIILVVSNLIITGISLLVIYHKSNVTIEKSLNDMVEHEATMVTVLYKQGKSEKDIIELIKNMRLSHYGIGKTGEYAIARQHLDRVQYVLSNQETFERPVSTLTINGVPMKMALSGKTGLITAKDYQGVVVLAAYTYVPSLKWGIVAKIPLQEVNDPYYQALYIDLGIAVLLILLSLRLFIRISNPIIRSIVESEEKFRRAIHYSPFPMLIHAEDGEILNISRGLTDITGYTLKDIPTIRDWTAHAFGSNKDTVANYIETLYHLEDSTYERIYPVTCKDQTIRIWDFSSSPIGKLYDGRKAVISIAIDITERKNQEEERDTIGRLIGTIQTQQEFSELLSSLTLSLQNWTRCEAVGIRLKVGNDFPYAESRGFPPKFVETEKSLCKAGPDGKLICDGEGNPVLDCMCGTVLCGQTVPAKPFFTSHGSFWTNNTTALLDGTSEEDRQSRTRNRCNGEGYQSVALIPLRNGTQVFGLLQFNDRRSDVFSKAQITKLERIADSMAISLSNRFAEKSLRESEARHSSMIANISDVISIIDKTGIISYISPNVHTWFGWYPEDLVGKEAWITIHPDDLEQMQKEFFSHQLEERSIVRVEYRHVCKDGSYKICELTGVNLIYDQTIQGILVNYHDITNRKQAELDLKAKTREIEAQNIEYRKINDTLSKALARAEESDRLKTAFLQNVSHEIRTPMNAIMGFSELMVKQYNNKPKLEKYSEIVKYRCKDLLDIINDLLDIAKIESGQLSVSLEHCVLKTLFTELTLFFSESQKQMGKQHIKFIVDTAEDPTVKTLVTDKVKLKQIFINLIGNAFKFTSTGEIRIGYNFDNNGHMIFYVSDTGIGIPADKHEKIFDRFMQMDNDKHHIYGGTGLGLSIVKGLVNLLGGSVWLESELCQGSTFYFTLPLNYSTTQPIEELFTEHESVLHFTNKTILLVEDDMTNAIYFKEILNESGLEIIHAILGKEAIQIALSHEIDLLLMDIRLPDITGYEATHEIMMHKPQMKIIAQTAYATPNERQNALDAGCIDYISKPFNQDMLMAMLNKYLS